MNAERIAYLVRRSLSAEHEVASVTRSVHTVYRDRIALSVVDTDGDGVSTFCVNLGRRRHDPGGRWVEQQ